MEQKALKKTDKNKTYYKSNFFVDYCYLEKFELQNRRYIGSKSKLVSWIMDIIQSKTNENDTFIDIFSGTGIVGEQATKYCRNVIFNDFLYSNNIIYRAFFEVGEWNEKKLLNTSNEYNKLKAEDIEDNYFSQNFGGKFYEKNLSKIIGYIRQDIENNDDLNSKEYVILLASLIYTIDRHANTVGHFDAYIKKNILTKPLNFRLIQPLNFKGVKIYREDANLLAKRIKGDIAYIDPPYNSRQYSRFYHIYENLIQWKKPKLYGIALKPKAENMSDYCTVKATRNFKELVKNLNVKYLAISYNNTYQSNSKSSVNKIQFDEIVKILNDVGQTEIFEKPYKYFNTGKTNFKDHKEFLFLTKKYE